MQNRGTDNKNNSNLPMSRSALQVFVAFFLITVITVICLVGASFAYDFYRGFYATSVLLDMSNSAKEVMHGYRWNKEILSEKLLKLNVLKPNLCKDSACRNLKIPFRSAKIIAGKNGIYLYTDLITDSPVVCDYLLTYDFKSKNGLDTTAKVEKENISGQEKVHIKTFDIPASAEQVFNACRVGIGEYILISYKFILN